MYEVFHAVVQFTQLTFTYVRKYIVSSTVRRRMQQQSKPPNENTDQSVAAYNVNEKNFFSSLKIRSNNFEPRKSVGQLTI